MNSIPEVPRYDWAKEQARKYLVEHHINNLPIDIIGLIKKAGIISLKTYSKLALKSNTSINDICLEFQSSDGVSILNTSKFSNKKYAILFNDTRKPKTRINWTLAHEFGHIILNHLVDFEQSKLLRSNISDSEYSVLDKEADAFAAELLVPTVVMIAAGWTNKNDVGMHCQLSSQASSYRSNYLRTFSPRLYLFQHYERELYYTFYNHIYKKFCPECKTSFIDRNAKYCPICGEHNLIWKNTEENIMKYSGILVDENSKAYTCPQCENEEIMPDGDHCMICGFYLINKCVGKRQYDEYGDLVGFKYACNKPLPGNARYCPYCGGESSFYADGILNDWKIEKNTLYDDTIIPF